MSQACVEVQAVHVGQSRRISSATETAGCVSLSWIATLSGREVKSVILLQMTAQDVLQGCGGEEEFLAQAQFLAGRRRIRRIEDAGQAFRLVAFAQRADVVAGVEGIEQDRVDRLGGPEAQRVDALAPPADDGRVEGRWR